MREYGVPALFVPAEQSNMTDALFDGAAEHPDQVAFGRRVGGAWMPVTSKECAEQVAALAAGLIAWGLSPGDRVGLFSRTRFEWLICDYAIWTAGGVTVPLYETSSAEQVKWELGNSGAVGVFVETEHHAAIVAQVRDDVAALRDVWVIESGGLERLTSQGVRVSQEQVTARRRQVKAGSLATIVYTSGTTGRPKGCVVTHANLMSEVGNVCAASGVEAVLGEAKATLLFLPLAHILARMIQLSTVATGTHLGHTSDLADLPARLTEFRPTSVLSVPRVFEKIYNTAQHRATLEGHGRIFAVAEAVAIRYSEKVDLGGHLSLLLRARRAVCDRLVYSKLRQAMGGRVEYAVSGGAPLGARLGHFFRGAGVNVLEGYGLTETCAGATLNLPGAQRMGSVGRPIPGCTIRIAADGEVLIKGGQVFQGYWRNEAATREVFDEQGWFHSGDLGEIDDDGFLTITGRKKDLIVTSSGKNVAPAVLEDRLRAHWLVSQCVVVGDARPYIGALVTIDTDVFPQWKREHGKPDLATVADLRTDPDLLAQLQEGVDDANKAVSAAESIKRFLVLSGDFTVDGGQLTPTLKVKRNVIFRSFTAELEALYS